MDAQEWGEEVTTTCMETFTTATIKTSGTRAPSVELPAMTRAVLRVYGSPQQDALGRTVSQRIGNLPDLKNATDSCR